MTFLFIQFCLRDMRHILSNPNFHIIVFSQAMAPEEIGL